MFLRKRLEGLCGWKSYGECGAFSRCTLDFGFSVVFFDGGFGDGKPKAKSFNLFFCPRGIGAVETIEDMRKFTILYTNSKILNLNNCITPFALKINIHLTFFRTIFYCIIKD